MSRITQDHNQERYMHFEHKAITLYGVSFQILTLYIYFVTFLIKYEDCVLQPRWRILLYADGLGFFLIARRYTGNNYCSLLLWVLRCFISPGALCTISVHLSRMTEIRFPHSEISGSKVVRHLPETYRSLTTSFFAM